MNTADQKLKIPAIIIIVIAVLTILMQLLSLIMNLVGAGANSADIASQIADPQARQFVQMMMGGQGVMGIVMSIIFILLNAFVIFGATQMMSAKSYGLAMATAIIYIVPCFSFCCIGMPFGIWALVLLLNDEVKMSFDQSGNNPASPV